MDNDLYKKINILLHLAKIDGRFESKEKTIVRDLLRAYHLDESYVDTHQSIAISFAGLAEIDGKEELLYWMLQLINADDYTHDDEITFAKVIASKMGFDDDAVDYYLENTVPALSEFTVDLQKFRLQQ